MKLRLHGCLRPKQLTEPSFQPEIAAPTLNHDFIAEIVKMFLFSANLRASVIKADLKEPFLTNFS